METSASFEARYAPSLYPTGGPKGQLTRPRGLPNYAEVVQDTAYCGLGCGLEKVHGLWSSPTFVSQKPVCGPRSDLSGVVNSLGGYGLHVWRGSGRADFGVSVVFQVHGEFKTACDRDVQCGPLQAGLGDRLGRAVFGRLSP